MYNVEHRTQKVERCIKLQKTADLIDTAAEPVITHAVDLSRPASDLFITTPQNSLRRRTPLFTNQSSEWFSRTRGRKLPREAPLPEKVMCFQEAHYIRLKLRLCSELHHSLV